MKRFSTLFFVALISIAALTTETTNAQELDAAQHPSLILAPFETLKVEADIDLLLVEVNDGTQLSLVYDLGDSDPSKFKARVRKAELKISQSYNARSIGRAKATLYYNSSLVNIIVDRANVTFKERYRPSIAQITVGDKATLVADVDSADLEIDVDGSSSLKLTGRCEYLYLKAKSSSKVEMREVESRSAEVEVSHGAVVAITAGERLKATTSTSGVIKYWDEPTILRKSKKLIGGSLQKQN